MRPKTVTVTTWVMATLNTFGYANLWHLEPVPKSWVIFLFLLTTLQMAFGYTVLWFFYYGRNWARRLVLLVSAIVPFSAYLALPSANPIVKVVYVAQAAVAVFLLIWLNTSQARTYFKGAAVQQIVVD